MRLVTAYVVLFSLATAVYAGEIRGRVLNAQGTAIAGAKVTVSNEDEGIHREATTSTDGSYTIPDLESGLYTVMVSTPGQETLHKEISIGQELNTAQVDFQVAQAPAQRPSVAQERNPNIFIYRIDFNDLRNLLMVARGPDPQYVSEFLPEQNYFGAEFGAPLLRFELLRPRPLAKSWYGSVFGAHQNSALNARNFFNVGPLRPSRASSYEVSGGGPLVADKASLLLQFGQNFTSGLVNGNIQAPTASERTPRSSDPRVNSIIANLLNAYSAELPNLPYVSLRQLNTNAPRDVQSTDGLARLDLKLTDTTSLAVRYATNDYSEDPFQIVAGQNPQTDLGSQSAYTDLTRTFSPYTVGRFGFHFDRTRAVLQPTRRFSNLLTSLGISTVPDIQFANAVSSSSELANIGPGPQFPRRRFQNRFQFYSDLRRTVGRHTLQGGWNTTRAQVNDLQSDNSRGTLSFASDFGRSAVDNFLRGFASTFTITLGNLYRGFRNWEHFFFFQDQIRLSPTSSLSIGVRYELMTAPTEVNNLTNVDFPTDQNNFAPRLGFAWNPGAGRTTIRASYGISYGTIFPASYQTTRFNPPATQVIVVDAPDLLNPLAGIPQQPTQGGRSSRNLLSPDLEFPYSHQYTLAIERALPSSSLLRVAYIGTRSFHLLSQGVYNRARFVSGIPTTTATINQRRLDPRYFAVNIIESNSIAYYDAIQVSWDKRLTRGLTLRAIYTFGKNIDTGGDFTNTAAGVEAPPEIGMATCEQCNRVSDQKGVSNFDTPHDLTIGYSYSVPFPVDANRWATALLKGWQISGTTVFQSGTPIHAHTGSDGPGFGNVDGASQDRPNILNLAILGKSLDNPDTSPLILRREYFDTNIPAGGRGNLGFNTFRKDGTSNWNFALSRMFYLPGGRENSLQFRAEFFNLFNHAQFDKPGVMASFATFGKITNTVNKGRQIQFSMRLSF
ncbi:MAG: TonB-dependent receptor [Acidobacteria bacterium]|nr:TonB-dependent receptor [Acidobacteriota bacterium]